MEKLEKVLTTCTSEVATKISESEYLKLLLKKKTKFEGWFQIELANCLYERFKKNNTYKILVEEKVDEKRFADIILQLPGIKDVATAIEIKFIVKNKSTTDSRKSLLNQADNNCNDRHQSYGIAVLVSNEDKLWFQEETKRINDYCFEKGLKTSIVSTCFLNDQFSVILIKSKNKN